jgi:sarcosine oxidase subunit beta
VAEVFDAIVIGAGSVGGPTAYFLSEAGLRVVVLEKRPSVGQGEHKSAIGGVRATHSDPAKIQTCQESLRVFASWDEKHGFDVGWKKGGYCFPVYGENEEQTLKGILPIQKGAGLNIDWLDADGIREVVPGIEPAGLRGGTFSPDDGQVSPLLSAHAFYAASKELGCEYRFNETVCAIDLGDGRVGDVRTDKGAYSAPVVVIAAGSDARAIGKLAGLDVPVSPDSHEAGISAPVAPFLSPLVVDIRPGVEGKTANFYFGQNSENRLIFCYTPSELFPGTNRESTSEFMPVIARRLISLIPRLENLYIRRVWRGCYPMTPDGIPIVDRVREVEGIYLGVGMCGQGFMLGPGVARNLTSLIVHEKSLLTADAFSMLSFYRDFTAGKEALK